ncbi:unnamed protein product, partial [Closterium sp. NIES-54]
MYAATDSAEGDCYLCVLPDPGIEAAALGASESAAPGTSESAAPGAGECALSANSPTEALHTFTLDSGASHSFFRNSTTLTPLSRPVVVSLADPSGGPVLVHSSAVLPCPAASSGLLLGLHLPSFSTNLVSGADLHDAWVDQFAPGGQRVTHCTCSRTGRHLATFTRRPGSSLYTLSTASPPVTASCQVAASGQVFSAASRSSPTSAPCLCRPLSHETLLWHHRLGHPSLPRLRGMASRTLLSESFGSDLPVLRLHSDRGGEFSSNLLRAFCRASCIRQTFTLPASPQQNGIAKRRIGMLMDVARSCMIHAAAPHFLWSFAIQYAAHQINLQPRVSLPETTPTLRWTGKVGDASDVTFDESVSYYRLFPYRTASLPPPPLFLAPGAPPVNPLPPERPTPSGVSQVDHIEPVEVAVDSGAARCAEPTGARTGGAEASVTVSEGAEPGGAELERVELGSAEPGGVESGSAEPGGAEPERAESGGPPGVPLRREPLSPQQLREWYARRCRGAAGAGGAAGAAGGAAGARAAGGASGATGGAAGAGAAGAAGPGGADAGGTGAVGGPAGVGAVGGAGAAGPGGARTGGTGAAGAGGAAGVGAVGAGAISTGGAAGARAVGGASRAAGGATGGTSAFGGPTGVGAAGGAGAAGPRGARTGGTRAAGAGGAAGVGAAGAGAVPTGGASGARAGGAAGVVAGDPGAEGTGAVSAVSGRAARLRPYYVPLLQQVLGLPPSTGPTPPLLSPPPVQSQSQLQPASPLP